MPPHARRDFRRQSGWHEVARAGWHGWRAQNEVMGVVFRGVLLLQIRDHLVRLTLS